MQENLVDEEEKEDDGQLDDNLLNMDDEDLQVK